MHDLLTNIRSLHICPEARGPADAGRIDRAAMAWAEGKIVWVGSEDAIPPSLTISEVIDAHGAIVIPGLVDCHTHLAFGGWRADEFEQRCQGVDYRQISAAGGGILRTMRMTRDMSEGQLAEPPGGFSRK